MAKPTHRKPDRRELPAYTIAEAAHYLSVPQATVRYWAKGQDHHLPLIDVPNGTPTLLSFLNLVELHVLAAPSRSPRALSSIWIETLVSI